MAPQRYGESSSMNFMPNPAHAAESCHQTTCESQSCPIRKDELAATTLVSFSEGQQELIENNHTCCHYISPDVHSLRFPIDIPAWNHILSCHGQEQTPHCIRPCLAESPLVFRECHIPAQFTDNLAPGATVNPNMICGVRFNGPNDFINHFNQYHRNALPISHEHHSSMMSTISSSIATPTTDMENAVSENEVTSSPENQLVLTEENKFTCFWMDKCGTSCSQKFEDSEQLHKHAFEVHVKSLPKEGQLYSCQWKGCTRQHKPFNQRSKLTRHLQVHTGYKSAQCEICGLSFSAKQALQQHMLKHSGAKPWLCEHCGKPFRQQSALTMHKRTHTGEKPLQCEICGKRFSESSNLAKHRKIHNEELPLKCMHPGCQKAFRRHDQLRRHLASHARKEQKQALRQAAGSSSMRTLPAQHPSRPTELDQKLDSCKITDSDLTILSDESCDDDGECCFEDKCEHGS